MDSKEHLYQCYLRAVAGIRGKTIIINLPGSLNAVSQSLNALFPGIMHAFKMIKGQGH